MTVSVLTVLTVVLTLAPGGFAQQSCETLLSPKLAEKFQSASEVNKKGIVLEVRRACGEAPSKDCVESTFAGLLKDFDDKNFYSVNSAYLNEERGIVVRGHKYKTRYLKSEADKAPYVADIKDGKVISKATGQPFEPWDPHVGPRSESWAQMLRQEKMGSEEAIFVINKKRELFVNPEPLTGTFHHSSFEAGAPVLAPGRLNLTHDGKIKGIDTYSGHYQAGQEMLDVSIDYFRKKGIELRETRRYFDNRLNCWRAVFE